MDFLVPKRRVRIIFCILIGIFTLVIVKVVHIHVTNGEELARKRDAQRRRIIYYPAIRGSILDSKGVKLALDVPVKAAYVEPQRVEDLDAAADLLTSVLKVSRAGVIKKLNSDRALEWIKRDVGKGAAREIKKARVKSVGIETVLQRSYPHGRSAASVVGFKGKDEGLEGIELVYESYLAGRPGYALLEKDAIGRNVPKSTRKKVPSQRGSDVILTLDLTIQHIAENELRKTLKKYKAEGGSVIVVEPATGRVLALASEPSFNSEIPPPFYRNRSISYVYEPGSTLKMIVVAAAVEARSVPVWEKRFHCTGSLVIGPDRIRDAHPSERTIGWLSLADILRYSSNTGAAQVGIRLGSRIMKSTFRRFNFGQKLGIGLNGEERGLLPSGSDWRPITLATVSYGQGISATPLQVASAYAAIANDGILMKPSLVERIVSSDEEALFQFEPREIRRVVSSRAARILTKMLVDVTEEGTGTNAKVDGFVVAGKTGTAQIPKRGGYAVGEYISSFVGYVPAEDPRILVMVVVEKPRGAYYGGTVAAPIFREVAKRTLWNLKVPPTNPLELVKK